jgi:hypothetical protein
MVPHDELDDYEVVVDREEAVVTELEQERELSDADEFADVEAEKDSTYFDRTRWVYSGHTGNGDGDPEDVDVRELQAIGAMLDDPDDDGDDSDD